MDGNIFPSTTTLLIILILAILGAVSLVGGLLWFFSHIEFHWTALNVWLV